MLISSVPEPLMELCTGPFNTIVNFRRPGHGHSLRPRRLQSRSLRQAGSANRGVSLGQGLIRLHIGSGCCRPMGVQRLAITCGGFGVSRQTGRRPNFRLRRPSTTVRMGL